jgi:hypothetical protein
MKFFFYGFLISLPLFLILYLWNPLASKKIEKVLLGQHRKGNTWKFTDYKKVYLFSFHPDGTFSGMITNLTPVLHTNPSLSNLNMPENIRMGKWILEKKKLKLSWTEFIYGNSINSVERVTNAFMLNLKIIDFSEVELKGIKMENEKADNQVILKLYNGGIFNGING